MELTSSFPREVNRTAFALCNIDRSGHLPLDLTKVNHAKLLESMSEQVNMTSVPLQQQFLEFEFEGRVGHFSECALEGDGHRNTKIGYWMGLPIHCL
jgi:hypothetical protein